MKKSRVGNFFQIMFFGYLFSVAVVQASEYCKRFISFSDLEEILQNADVKYVNLSRESSQLYEIISLINSIDDNPDSLSCELQKYIEGGLSIGIYDSVLEALYHSQDVLQRYALEKGENVEKIQILLADIIEQVKNDSLTIDRKDLGKNDFSYEAIKNAFSHSLTKHCPTNNSCSSHCNIIKVRSKLEVFDKARFRKSVQIDKDLSVHGKARFKDDVTFKDDVKFEDDVKFKDDVHIEGDLTVDGTVMFNGPVVGGVTIIDTVIENLSATDVVIENLSATDIFVETLSAVDGFFDNLSVANCIDDLCITNLSVVDVSISGILSVNDIFVEDLSATNAIIDNLTVGTISITDCLDSLCVENISIVDGNVSGTLSINDAIIDELTVGSLSVTDCIGNLCVDNLSVTDLVVVNCIDDLCITNLSVSDASISGVLSANDIFVEDLSATNATIDSLTVGTISVTDCITSLCVEDISIVDGSVSGIFSINDAVIDTLSVNDVVILNCIESACIEDLSVVDGSVSGTLSVNDLVVTDCIDDLCVINLSAVDVSISGVLSVTDAVVGTIGVACDLTVGCNILMNNSISPTVGNVMKAGNRFLHNFGTDNTFVGINAGNFTMGGAENVGIGRNALFSNATGFNNVAVGSFALTTNTIGANNDAIGAYSLVNNTDGNENAALGNYTLVTNTTGSGNTAVGFQAGYSLEVGNNNIFVGNNAARDLTDGFTNVIIGYNGGISLTTGNDNIYIANAGVNTEDGIIRIGTASTHVETYIQGIFGTTVENTGIPVFVDANGQLGTVVSSAQFKNNIEELKAIESEIVYDLNPVTFSYKSDSTGAKQYGLIAEEVANVSSELVVYDKQGKPFTVRYHLLPILLLNEIKRLKGVVCNQASQIKALQADTAQLYQAMKKIMEGLQELQL